MSDEPFIISQFIVLFIRLLHLPFGILDPKLSIIKDRAAIYFIPRTNDKLMASGIRAYVAMA
jgi:hypothetical protein